MLIPLVIAAVVAGLRRLQRRRVAESSSALGALGRLNHRFGEVITPLPAIDLEFFVRVDSKSKFDSYDLARYLREEVLVHEQEFEAEIAVRRQAVRHYLDYEAGVGAEVMSRLGRSSRDDMRQKRFDRVETDLYEKGLLQRPTPEASVRAALRYTSPQGRNAYSRTETWGFDELRQGLAWAREERARRSTTQHLHQRERALMTPSLRADVLRRDGSRCRACGASSADRPLHIDHILPVSRGGRTELTNLQTLCQACNLGKGNRFVG
ncbi:MULTISPECIES: HNH endonuclease [unclassified Microbacterium]|uniref:HNH endonuclease n=1 Tax=unclassified Microbacterium TaxID=2609290 RepID=UPI003869C582